MWTLLNRMLTGFSSTARSTRHVPVSLTDAPDGSYVSTSPRTGEATARKRSLSGVSSPGQRPKRMRTERISLEPAYPSTSQQHTNEVVDVQKGSLQDCASPQRPSPRVVHAEDLSLNDVQPYGHTMSQYQTDPVPYASRSSTPSLAYDLPSSDFDFDVSSPIESPPSSFEAIEDAQPLPEHFPYFSPGSIVLYVLHLCPALPSDQLILINVHLQRLVRNL